jgi:hypothetical protein
MSSQLVSFGPDAPKNSDPTPTSDRPSRQRCISVVIFAPESS